MAQILTAQEMPGEGGVAPVLKPEVIVERRLTFDEASKGLHILGKDETGSRYAYLMITVNGLKLTDIKTILNFRHVIFLDLNNNYLTIDALQVLTDLPYLVLLKAERNRVESATLCPMYYLQVLDLNQNQIKHTRDIVQPLLETLEISFNDIYETDWTNSNLRSLKQLELRSNLLYEISGLYPENIEKLYLPANKIASINEHDLGRLKNLEILHLRDNVLERLDGFSEHLENLKYLNLRNNKIKTLKEFLKLKCLPKLETLIVIGNPITGAPPTIQSNAGEAGEGGGPIDVMIIPLLVMLPNLKRINKTVIAGTDRMKAEDMERDVLDQILLQTPLDLGSSSELMTEKTGASTER